MVLFGCEWYTLIIFMLYYLEETFMDIVQHSAIVPAAASYNFTDIGLGLHVPVLYIEIFINLCDVVHSNGLNDLSIVLTLNLSIDENRFRNDIDYETEYSALVGLWTENLVEQLETADQKIESVF